MDQAGPPKCGVQNAECRIRKQGFKLPFRIPKSSFRIGLVGSARPILRELFKASRKKASPADAFCPEAPCPRATTQAPWKCQSATGGPPAQPGFYLIENIGTITDYQSRIILSNTEGGTSYPSPACFPFPLRAIKIFSAVMGSSRTRTPTAS